MGADIDIALLVEELCRHDAETEWIEFKTNNSNPEMIGQRISALANSACRLGAPTAYMVWGIDDETHKVVGSSFRYRLVKKGNEELENWLHHQLTDNASFEFAEGEVGGMHVTVLMVHAAFYHTVDFERVPYVRVGSYTKKLREYPTIESEVWGRITKFDFESVTAIGGLPLPDALSLLDFPKYFDLLGMPMPQSRDEVAHYLCDDEVLSRQDDGRYAVTNLGALLLAKRLRDFPSVARKALRLVQYEGRGRTEMLRSRDYEGGYAVELEAAVEMVMALTPAREDVVGAVRTQTNAYPERAVREILANALIHQDLAIAGSGPVIEVFADRVDFTNPGTSLVDLMRLVDNPPKSRNQRLASLMRRFRFCEELGTGWDRIISSCEASYLPAPRVVEYEEAGGSVRISLMPYAPYRSLNPQDRVMACYWHACICFTRGDVMTNQSLRSRFGEGGPSPSTVSKLLSAAVEARLIKPVDPTTAPRYMRYVPAWAQT